MFIRFDFTTLTCEGYQKKKRAEAAAKEAEEEAAAKKAVVDANNKEFVDFADKIVEEVAGPIAQKAVENYIAKQAAEAEATKAKEEAAKKAADEKANVSFLCTNLVYDTTTKNKVLILTLTTRRSSCLYQLVRRVQQCLQSSANLRPRPSRA